MKTKEKTSKQGTDFIELCELTVGKEVTKQILESPVTSELDTDIDNDELTDEQINYMNEMLDKFKK